MEKKKICAECVSWEPGDYWMSGDGRHGVAIEAPGFCMFKKDKNGNIVKRKRWNYCTACPNFAKKKMNGFIYQGGGDHTIQEDLANIGELMREMVEDNQ